MLRGVLIVVRSTVVNAPLNDAILLSAVFKSILPNGVPVWLLFGVWNTGLYSGARTSDLGGPFPFCSGDSSPVQHDATVVMIGEGARKSPGVGNTPGILELAVGLLIW